MKLLSDQIQGMLANSSAIRKMFEAGIELKKKYGDEVYFYNKAVEVDFSVPEQEWLIQVAYSIAEEETREREISALLKVGKHLKAEKRTIITYNEEETITVNDIAIEVIPLWKWLLK